MQGGQDIEALTAGGSFDKQPLHAPQNAQKRGKHKVGCIQEEDRAVACLRFG